jgi:hypothetical protein
MKKLPNTAPVTHTVVPWLEGLKSMNAIEECLKNLDSLPWTRSQDGAL